MQENRFDETQNKELRPDAPAENAATVIPVIEEQIVVDKYVVERGKVRVSKRVSEHEEIVDEPLFHEEVSVERVPVNRIIENAPAVRNEGDTLVIPIVEERIFVEKRLVLIEELRVKKQLVETHQPQKITLRKEQVEINRVVGNTEPGK
ncbi:MAG TPA: YsnF/AvaK domain-containing protein [Pyrinomonadaceae bacterium]|jgi:uncharacterized protein (TIGR02271 family)